MRAPGEAVKASARSVKPKCDLEAGAIALKQALYNSRAESNAESL
jgi:hypothetical protein